MLLEMLKLRLPDQPPPKITSAQVAGLTQLNAGAHLKISISTACALISTLAA
jgi:hypothetical protein